MLIRDIMTTDPSYCVPEDSSAQAARLMRQMNAGIVPVVASASNRRVLGVVTDRDLCMAVIAADVHPKTVKLGQCMSTNIIAADPSDDIDKAVQLMRDHQVRRILVLNGAGELEGVVSTADVFHRSNVSATRTHEALTTVSEPSSEQTGPAVQTSH
ncbi:CBS domain-containing protein YhcV [Nitrospira sp. KM1]|uniref:CBS domain-containing protein n=1 Tax=Nitrospira sp. KM1 TaxID=1936990 RepID=UPI0013A714C5|nr:CBS domain-containing protein [Nitrospira sp. KM1]BCA56049.1 CBS domain-containing protein YhcV [Nitrospira sp. KM1]